MKRILLYTGRVSKGSGRCRAMDIAEHPEWPWPLDLHSDQVTKEDIVILVKCWNDKIIERAGKAYVDIVDGIMKLHGKIAANPDIGVVVQAETNVRQAKDLWFHNNEVIWLPHTHCNNERAERPTNRAIKTIGYTGTCAGFPPDKWDEFKIKITQHGFAAVHAGNSILDNAHIGNYRKICCQFYEGIDIAVSYRAKLYDLGYGPCMKGPTKLNNAGSFRIPTVTFPEWAYIYNLYGHGSCVMVMSIDEMVEACVRLRDDKQYYNRIAGQAWSDSQAAHIDEVVKAYRSQFNV